MPNKWEYSVIEDDLDGALRQISDEFDDWEVITIISTGSTREIWLKRAVIDSPRPYGKQLQLATKWLKRFLVTRDGLARSGEIRFASDKAGFAWATMIRAKDALGVVSQRGSKQEHEGNFIYWQLP